MRYDRGTRIFTRYTTKVGDTVWVPYVDDWYPGEVKEFVFHSERGDCIIVEFSVLDHNDSLAAFPLWRLRERKLHLNGHDKPDEPIPPTHGRPRGNPATKRVGILWNGDVRGRA